MSIPPEQRARAKQPYPLVVAVLIMGVLLSLLTALGLYLWERSDTQASLERAGARVEQVTRECLSRQIANARLVAMLFSVLPEEIGAAEFARIAAFLPSECQANEALGWVPRVTAAQRTRFEARLGRESERGLAEYTSAGTLAPAGPRPEYFPLHHVVPNPAWRPQGYDLGSNPRQRLALERARDTADASFAPAAPAAEDLGGELLQELYFPAYRPGASHETLTERRANLRGLVVAVVNLHQVLEKAMEWSGSPPFEVRLFRSSEGGDWIRVYVQRAPGGRVGSEPNPGVVPPALISLGGERWRLEFLPRPGVYSLAPGWLPLGALVGGLIATVLAGLYLQTRKERSESEERHVRALKREVAERRLAEERFRIALKASSVSVFNQDDKLRYTWVQNLWDERSLLGGNDYDVADTAEDAEHLMELKRRVLSSGRGMREHVKIRIRGVDRFFHVALEPQFEGNGKPVGIVGAVVDVTEHLQLQSRLRQQAKQLAEADRRKDEFLSLLAHELRNPLAPISNAVQVLKREKPLSETTAAWAEAVIDRQTQQLTHLVDDLLDVARITRGQIALTRRAIDLGEVIAQAVEAARPLMEQRGHELSVGFPVEPLWIEGDRTRLIQVLGNLLDNAAKYTPPNGRIEVLASHMGSDAVISVRDNGIGIPAEVLPYVFDMFTHAKHPDRPAPEGLGLGLSISRSLIEMHRGRVEAISAGVGKGSEFRVFLPTLSVPTAQTGEPPREGPPAGGLNVLVVEDSADVAKSFALLLGALGHRVQVAHDANAGLEAARGLHFDAAFLDIRMPGMNGYELARLLRRQHGDRLTLVAVTGYGQASDREQAFAAGFDEHLLKPVNPDALEAVLRTAAARARGPNTPPSD